MLQTLRYNFLDKLDECRISTTRSLLQSPIITQARIVVALDIGNGITVLHQNRIHQQTSHALIPVDERMDGHEFLVQIRRPAL